MRRRVCGAAYVAPVLAAVAFLGCTDAFSVSSLPGVSAVRNRWVMVGIDLLKPGWAPYPPEVRAGHRLAMAARARGVVLRPLGDTLVINPPLALSLDEADLLFSSVGDLLEAGTFV